MNRSIGNPSTEDHHQEVHRDIRKKFKELMQLSILVSRRERKAIASDMHISAGLLCDWLNPGKPESMPAHYLASWTKEVGKDVLRWIAKENGLLLVEEESEPAQEIHDSAQLLALISVHHGRLMGQIIQAREDDVIDDKERRLIFPEICRLIHELEAEAEYFRPSYRPREEGVS